MALVVEDGSCVAAANAFVTRAELIAYAADYLPSTTIADDTATDGAILRASSWISSFPQWAGTRTCGRDQGLAWPRTGTEDCDGASIPNDVVPEEVKMATFAASISEINSPGLLTPLITPGEQVKSEKVDVISQQFMTPQDQGVRPGAYDPLNALRPMVAQVQDYLRCLASFPNDTIKTPWPWVA